MLRTIIFLLCTTFVYSSSIRKSRLLNLTAPGEIQREARIINGEPALPGDIPWQAALYITKSEENLFCGGTIISQEWILTTAVCLDGAVSVRVHVGSILESGGIQIPGASIIIHENYNPETIDNDIGLIQLSVELLFDGETSAITLAQDSLEAGREVVVSGWGATSDGSTDTSGTLYYAFLSTISNSDCATIYGTLSDSVLCAVSANEIKGICYGDSGGPLVSNINTLPILVGIASFASDKGCEAGDPSGFTRVASYRSWIQTNTGV